MLINGNLTLIGELRGLKPQRLAADPTGGDLVEGLIWINTTDKAMRWYDGTEVTTVASGGALSDYLELAGGTMTGALTLSGDATESLHAVTLQQLTTGLGEKQDTIEGAATTILDANLEVSRAMVTDENGKVAISDVTATELSYLDGVTSAIQTQLDGKEASLGYVPVNKAGDSLSGNLNFGGTATLKNLSAPVDPTDAVRLIDIDNLKADLDFQSDVLGVQLDDTLVPTVEVLPDAQVRYIVTDAANLNAGFGTVAGLEDGDIIQKDGEDFVVVYDVSERGPGALVWDRGVGKFMKFDGTSWTEHGGLSGVTASAGLIKEGNTLSVAFGAGVANLPTGEVGIDVRADGGLRLVDPTTGDASTATDAVLSVLVDSTLALSAQGVGVASEGITSTHIAPAALGQGLTGGAGTALTVQLDGTTLVKSAAGLAVGDLTDTYLGLSEDATLTGQVAVPAPTADASIANKLYVDNAVDTAGSAVADLSARVDGGVVVFDGVSGSAQTSYSINHALGNRFVAVSVYDESYNLIVPDSVTLTDANNLTVTLAVAQKIWVVINGVKAAA